MSVHVCVYECVHVCVYMCVCVTTVTQFYTHNMHVIWLVGDVPCNKYLSHFKYVHTLLSSLIPAGSLNLSLQGENKNKNIVILSTQIEGGRGANFLLWFLYKLNLPLRDNVYNK